MFSHPRRGFIATTLLLVASMAASLTLPFQALAATLTFAPTADSYVSSGAATSNFGTQTTMQVGTSPTRWAYLMFNVTGLTGAPTSASLRLWATAGGGSTAKTAPSTWTETGLTYNNRPTPNTSPTKTMTSTTGAYVSYDVTGFYTANGSWTFQFSSAAGVTFASKEDVAHAPQLTIVGPSGPTVPAAPTGVSAVAGNAQATVSWTIPASDGGSPISGYTVTSSPGGVIGTASGATATSAIVSGLTNNTSYTFTVHATNGLGNSLESTPSNAVTPTAPTVPGAPINVSAVAGNGQATVSWTIPASNGGSAILDYTVTSTPDTRTAIASGPTATSATVTSLTNGTPYTFTVHARNGVGNSAESLPSNQVTPNPPTVPGAPTNASAVAGNTQATVSWTIPASNGGSAILSYTATSSPEGHTATVSGATATSVIVPGLTNTVPYSFTVHATNGIGNSLESNPSNTVTPSPTTIPGAPTNVGAAPGNAQATVSWTIPSSNGGSAILNYTVTSTPGNLHATATGATATSATVTGLTNGTSYTFTVHATNGVGNSVESAASNAVTPSASLPVIRRKPYLTDTTTTSTLVNYATSAGGSPLPSVRWDLASGNCANPPNTASVTTLMATLSGLPAGTSYQYKTVITGLSADTAYCYRVYQNGADLNGVATTFRTALPSGSATPFKFAVIGDWGQGTTDQAGVASQIAAASPNLLLTVGDNVYASGSQGEYGDLTGGNVFPSQYLPTMGSGLPIFAAQGNHGFTSNSAYVQNFPQDAVTASSGGKFLQEAYSGIPGSSNATYASTWFAFTWGRARFYVLEAAWADGNGAYGGDYQAHWNTANSGCTPVCGGELTWLQADLAANASVPLKFAFFHYPLYSDSPSEVTDTNLNGASPHLEGELAAAGVNLVFTGHSHQYERNVIQSGGPRIVNYITGGGGAALGSLGSCSPWDAYAIAGGNHCGAAPASNPPSSFHYLLVSVNGNQVTVTPTDKTGLAFDVQTYTFGTPPPAAPTGLAPTPSNSAVALSWTASAGATSYNVKRGTAPGGPYSTISGPPGTVTGTTFTDGTVTNGTTYYYVVTAVNGGGESANSSQVSATPQLPAPAAPTGLAPTAGNQQVTLNWNPSSGATGYNVYRGTTSGTYGPTPLNGSTPVAATTYPDTGLSNGTTYFYVVRAVNGGGESGNSNEASATPQPPSPPAPPTNLTASTSGGDQPVALSWTASSLATSYNVKRSTTSGSGYTTISTAGAVTTPSFSDTTALSGTTYFYVVSAVNGAGESGDSTEASATLRPAAPTSLTPTPGDTQVALSWTAPGGTVASYNVKRSTTSGSGYVTISTAGTVTGTTYTDTGLTNGTTYYYVVSAVNGGGESVNSSQASATPQPPAPAAPIGVTGSTTGAGDQPVSLSWTAPSGPVDSYNVKRGTSSSGPFGTISTAGTVTTNAYTDSTAVSGATYYYVVSAVNGGGESVNSAPSAAITLRPAVPANLTPTPGNNQVALAWTASSGAGGYNVKRSTTLGGPYATIGSPSGATYTDTGLTNGITYYYVVSAVNTGGESANSTEVSGTPQPPAPGIPSGLVAARGDTQVGLTWNTVTSATSYNVKRATVNGGPYTTISTAGAVTTGSYTDTSLTNGTTYYYVVSAVNGGGESPNSAQVSATPQPPAPAAPIGLTPTPGNNQVSLSWNASTGATSYNVKRATVSGGPFTTISGPPGTWTTTSFTDSGAVNGTTYYYVVSAQNGGGESLNSPQVSATPQPPIPAAPTALTPTAGNNQVALSWTAPAGTVASYNVKRGTVSGGPYTNISAPGAVTTPTYTDTTVVNGTTYYYVVSAVNGGGEGPNSTQASATPTGTRAFVFSDGFETGSLSNWTTNGGLTVQSTLKRTGTYAAQGNTTNGATYAKKLLATTYTNGYFRIWFYLASGYTAQVNVLRYRTAADASMGYLFVSTTGKLSERNDIGAVTTTSATSVTSNAWHALELHLVVNGTSSSTEVWLDNVKINDLSLTAQNWGTTPIGKVQIGEVQAGRTYNVTFDDVAFDTAQVGLLPIP